MDSYLIHLTQVSVSTVCIVPFFRIEPPLVLHGPKCNNSNEIWDVFLVLLFAVFKAQKKANNDSGYKIAPLLMPVAAQALHVTKQKHLLLIRESIHEWLQVPLSYLFIQTHTFL